MYAEPVMPDVERAALVAVIDAQRIVVETLSMLPRIGFGQVSHLVRAVTFSQVCHAAHSTFLASADSMMQLI